MDFFGQLEPAAVAQIQRGHHAAHLQPVEELQRQLRGLRGQHPVAARAQQLAQLLEAHAIAVDDEDCGGGGADHEPPGSAPERARDGDELSERRSNTPHCLGNM